MTVEVLLFARAREACGTDRLTVTLTDGLDVRACVQQVEGRHEALKALRGRLLVAVNERYAAPDATLQDGDVVALIPPVSGG